MRKTDQRLFAQPHAVALRQDIPSISREIDEALEILLSDEGLEYLQTHYNNGDLENFINKALDLGEKLKDQKAKRVLAAMEEYNVPAQVITHALFIISASVAVTTPFALFRHSIAAFSKTFGIDNAIFPYVTYILAASASIYSICLALDNPKVQQALENTSNKIKHAFIKHEEGKLTASKQDLYNAIHVAGAGFAFGVLYSALKHYSMLNLGIENANFVLKTLGLGCLFSVAALSSIALFSTLDKEVKQAVVNKYATVRQVIVPGIANSCFIATAFGLYNMQMLIPILSPITTISILGGLTLFSFIDEARMAKALGVQPDIDIPLENEGLADARSYGSDEQHFISKGYAPQLVADKLTARAQHKMLYACTYLAGDLLFANNCRLAASALYITVLVDMFRGHQIAKSIDGYISRFTDKVGEIMQDSAALCSA